MIQPMGIGLGEALGLVFDSIVPLSEEMVALTDAVDRVVATDVAAKVDSPSVDASLKDGYAVRSAEVAGATADHPVRLTLKGYASAGDGQRIRLMPGYTVRVLTGACIPDGADAVVAEEFTKQEGDRIVFNHFAEPGRNVMARGSDVALGAAVVRAGLALTPGCIGLLAAAGHDRVPVTRRPTVAIMATGDEVVAPGVPLPEGKLYASNMAALDAWCRRYGWPTRLQIVPDAPEALHDALQALVAGADAVVTSGGAWTGDRDLVVKILERLGWQQVFHRIRIGPGKAVGFGTLAGKPIFILPGGPPSNMQGFLQIALPGILALGGISRPGLPTTCVRLGQTVTGRSRDWTQLIFGTLEPQSDVPLFHPLRNASRLQDMAQAQAIVAIVEGLTQIAAGTLVSAQLLR
jgi:molybdopterin molybdotransferase